MNSTYLDRTCKLWGWERSQQSCGLLGSVRKKGVWGCGGLSVLISARWPAVGWEGNETSLLCSGPRRLTVDSGTVLVFSHSLSPQYCSQATVKPSPPQDC